MIDFEIRKPIVHTEYRLVLDEKRRASMTLQEKFTSVGTYSLNTLFNVSRRYGEWTLQGYLYYVDGINNGLRADTQLYGGAGIGFRY